MIGENSISIDNWIKFEMNGYQASLICALRQFIETLVVDASSNPDEVTNFNPVYVNAISVIRDLCAMDAGDHEISRNVPQGNRPMPNMSYSNPLNHSGNFGNNFGNSQNYSYNQGGNNWQNSNKRRYYN